jgi:hypothetical protein
VRAQVPGWLQQAQQVRDPFGEDNPLYADMVAGRIRAKVGEIEYAQAQQDRANRDTLYSTLMGVPAIGSTPAPSGMVAQQPARKPTTLDQAFQANPAARTAFAAATPEMQRSFVAGLEQNARQQNEGPPMTQAALDRYYQLSGEAVTNREAFQKENLADPALYALLPRHLLLSLMAEQHRADARSMVDQQREASLLHATQVLAPDMLAAGIKVAGVKPGTADATTLQQFTGRLSEALEQFQAANKRRPTDEDVKKIGQGLLMQGTSRGGGLLGLWDSPTRFFQAQSAGRRGPAQPGRRAAVRLRRAGRDDGRRVRGLPEIGRGCAPAGRG